jgi:hypothetical protein
MKTLATYAVLLSACWMGGCASTNDFPTKCDVKTPDRQGPGYTTVYFPCQTVHHDGGKP